MMNTKQFPVKHAFALFLGLLFLFSSCTNKVTVDNFVGIDGLLYYEKPETGSVVYAVFLPFSKKSANLDLQNLDSNDYENGIKFGTANSLIKSKLYSEKCEKLILKGGIDRQVYLLPQARVYFHVDESIYNEDNVIEETIKVDTLVYKGKQLKFKYRFSWVELDSIKAQ